MKSSVPTKRSYNDKPTNPSLRPLTGWPTLFRLPCQGPAFRILDALQRQPVENNLLKRSKVDVKFQNANFKTISSEWLWVDSQDQITPIFCSFSAKSCFFGGSTFWKNSPAKRLSASSEARRAAAACPVHFQWARGFLRPGKIEENPMVSKEKTH